MNRNKFTKREIQFIKKQSIYLQGNGVSDFLHEGIHERILAKISGWRITKSYSRGTRI